MKKLFLFLSLAIMLMNTSLASELVIIESIEDSNEFITNPISELPSGYSEKFNYSKTSLNSQRWLNCYYFNFEDEYSNIIEIHPLEGSELPYTLEYEYSYYNKELNVQIYSNEFADVIIGEKFIAYKDRHTIWWFKLQPCKDPVT